MQRADQLSQVFRHLCDGALAAFNLLVFGTAGDSPRKPTVSAENDLEVLTQIVTGYGQQHGVKVDAALKVPFVPLAPVGADLVHLAHHWLHSDPHPNL